MSEELSRYVGYEVMPQVYRISLLLSRDDYESAKDAGKELLDSVEKRLSKGFMFEPEMQSLSLEISDFVGKIHQGEDTKYSLSRVYGEAEEIVPWLKKDGIFPYNKNMMMGNYPVY